ncbi:MAG: diguanylate cyclase [Bacteroidetes bacterium]|nr:diguanylate cyclase [Bacteroidota bacterium]
MSFFKKLQNPGSDRMPDQEQPHAGSFAEGVSQPRPYRPGEGPGAAIKPPVFKTGRESGSDINKALEQVLWIVKESLDVHSVFLFWVNRNRKQFVLESSITDSGVFSAEERLPFIEGQFLQMVADGRKPVIRFRLTAEEAARCAGYYSFPEKIQSFAGVPVFFGEEVCAVFGADSLRADCFGGEELSVFNRLADLVSHLVYIYSGKDDLEFTGKAARQTSLYMIELGREREVSGIIRQLAELIGELMEFSYAAVVCFDEEGRLSVQKSISRGDQPWIEEGSDIALDHSIIGGVMRSLRPVVLKSTEASLDGRYRFHPGEAIAMNNSLLAVPVFSNQKCYGALLLEHEVRGWFTHAHVQALEQTGYMTGLAIENLLLTAQVNHQRIYDETTGLYGLGFFTEQVSVELVRAARVGYDCCLVLFEIDRFEELESEHGPLIGEEALRLLARILNLNLRNFDWLGRVGPATFGALMVHTEANSAHLISGKIRESLASTPVRLDRTELALTVSVGISRFKREKPSLEAMMTGARAALDRAREQGGNNIKTT